MLTFVLGAAGAESVKSARIGAFAVVLAVAAGVGARRRGKFIRSPILKFAAWTIATPVPRIG
jgi:hypothetical protein